MVAPMFFLFLTVCLYGGGQVGHIFEPRVHVTTRFLYCVVWDTFVKYLCSYRGPYGFNLVSQSLRTMIIIQGLEKILPKET